MICKVHSHWLLWQLGIIIITAEKYGGDNNAVEQAEQWPRPQYSRGSPTSPHSKKKIQGFNISSFGKKMFSQYCGESLILSSDLWRLQTTNSEYKACLDYKDEVCAREEGWSGSVDSSQILLVDSKACCYDRIWVTMSILERFSNINTHIQSCQTLHKMGLFTIGRFFWTHLLLIS